MQMSFISSKVKFSKPDIRIFEILLNKYSLLADECLFIDDLEENVLVAESVGMTSIWAMESVDLSEEIEKVL